MPINVTKRRVCRFLFFATVLSSCICAIDASRPEKKDDFEFTDIGVRLVGGRSDQLLADLIAEERDVRNTGHISGVNLYHFQVRQKRNHRSKRTINDIVEDLKRDERVSYVTVGSQVQRAKRGYRSDDALLDLYKKYEQRLKTPKVTYKFDPEDAEPFKLSFDDTLYQKQWYLENEGQFRSPPGYDINIAAAWLAGYTGKDVLISIVDDGLDHRHLELTEQYVAKLSYDLNDLNDPDHDPLPGSFDGMNSHGTQCAGTAAAKANNGLCGVGSAFNARLSAIRVLDGPITTLLEARALAMFTEETHIKSASWGPTDDGTKLEGPSELAAAALHHGVTKGRGGLGTLYVWASGNGGDADDDCGADGYVSNHEVISIGSINHLGNTVYFGEKCPSTLAVVNTGGVHIARSGEESFPVGVSAPDVDGKCTTSFAGTSSAAPLAAGAFAIVLEANPELTYRDVMHIVTETARIPQLTETDDWIINGAGYHVSDKFGFGVLDVGQMVAVAQTWVNVPPRYECYQEYVGKEIKIAIGGIVEIPLVVKDCPKITRVEHVVANISFSYHRRGDVKITIISPSGTPSELLSFRKNDASHHGTDGFPFQTTHNWGEKSEGTWLLRIETRQPQTSEAVRSAQEYPDLGALKQFGLRVFGSSSPLGEKNDTPGKRTPATAFAPSAKELESMYNRELQARNSPNILQKREHEQRLEQKRKTTEPTTTRAPSIASSIVTNIKNIINYIRFAIKDIPKIIHVVEDAIKIITAILTPHTSSNATTTLAPSPSGPNYTTTLRPT